MPYDTGDVRTVRGTQRQRTAELRNMHDEGVIKFQAEHQQEVLSARRYGDLACTLVAWREILARTGLVGQDPARYGGFGYGNVSARTGAPSAPRQRRPFLITGTQTSGRTGMSLDDFCLVETCDPAATGYRAAAW